MDYVTKIINFHIPRRRNWWCLFGHPTEIRSVSAHDAPTSAKILGFSAGTVFGVSHQRFNDFGLTEWEIWFLRACRPGDEGAHVPGIKPGAEILLYVRGKKLGAIIQNYLEVIAMHGISPNAAEELHREAAPYLEHGVIPQGLIETYASRSCHE